MAESNKGSVRTMSGKSHRPRPLVKDRNLSPREARTRKQVRGESFGGKISLPDGETMTGFYFTTAKEVTDEDPMAQDGVIVFWPWRGSGDRRTREALQEQGWSYSGGVTPEPHWQYPPYAFYRLSGVTVEDINNFILKYNAWVDHNPEGGRRKIPYPWNGVFSTYEVRRPGVPNIPQVAQYYDMMAENFEAEGDDEKVWTNIMDKNGNFIITIKRELYDIDDYLYWYKRDFDVERVPWEDDAAYMIYRWNPSYLKTLPEIRSNEMIRIQYNDHTWGEPEVFYARSWQGVMDAINESNGDRDCYHRDGSNYEPPRDYDIEIISVGYNAESKGGAFRAEKGKERVVESKEESGIITKTVQREDKSYDVDKMRASIPKKYRNQVDEDDRLVGAIGVALGVVATIAYQRFTKAFDEWKARRGE